MRLTRSLAYIVAGVAWMIADFVNWRSQGMLTHSTLADAAHLIRAHALHYPYGNAVAIVAVPILGLALVATALWHHVAVEVARALIAISGLIVAAFLVLHLGAGGVSSYGLGAWLAVAGICCAATGLLGDGLALARLFLRIKSTS